MAEIDAAELEEIEESLTGESAFLYESPSSFIAGVHAAVEAVEERLDRPE